MIRRAFTMRLKPDSLTEYKHHHDNIWPELVAEIERSGIASITTFQRDLDLFLVSEISDEAAWDKLWNSEVHRRWAELMQPLMHLRDDGIVEAGELNEVFHLRVDNNGQMSVAAEFAEPVDVIIAEPVIVVEDAPEQLELNRIFAAMSADPAPPPVTAEPARKKSRRKTKKSAAKTKSGKKKSPAKKTSRKQAAKSKRPKQRGAAKATKKTGKKKSAVKKMIKSAKKKSAKKKR